jgi:hypothetical protein
MCKQIYKPYAQRTACVALLKSLNKASASLSIGEWRDLLSLGIIGSFAQREYAAARSV